MRIGSLLILFVCAPWLRPETEAGFVPIFNGKDLSGWHISEVNRHGNTDAWTVKDGVLSGTQKPVKNGGVLLTDKKYRDFEISLDIWPDWGCDGGVLLRSNEEGQAYQVMIDYLEGGNVSGVHGEGLKQYGFQFDKGQVRRREKNWKQFWKANGWNHLRARIQGQPAHVEVWLNGQPVVDWTDYKNHLPNNAEEGMIGLQVHRSGDTWSRWTPGGFHRFRNIRIKELKP